MKRQKWKKSYIAKPSDSGAGVGIKIIKRLKEIE